MVNKRKKILNIPKSSFAKSESNIVPSISFTSQRQRLEQTCIQEIQTKSEISSCALYLNQICIAPIEIEVLQAVLESHNWDTLDATFAIFGDDIPRMIQGVRL